MGVTETKGLKIFYPIEKWGVLVFPLRDKELGPWDTEEEKRRIFKEKDKYARGSPRQWRPEYTKYYTI